MRAAQIETLRQLPERLRAAVAGLNDAQLDTPYREGGWTVRQVVHHLADSHANSYIRFKLALTEDWPTIKPYDEAAWARLPDSRMPIDRSLVFIDALHARWVALLESMSEEDFQRGFNHPERGRMTLATTSPSTPGTRAITPPTSPACARAWAGKDAMHDHRQRLGDPRRSRLTRAAGRDHRRLSGRPPRSGAA